MKVYPDLMSVMRRGRVFHSPRAKRLPILDYILAALGLFILTVLFCSCSPLSMAAERGVIPDGEVKEVAQILYAEAASDPEGWLPKLNTYFKAKRRAETFLGSMKRVSSAYRTRSKQYRKAAGGDLNAYERKVYGRIVAEVKAFRPDPNWDCVHHEDFGFYPSRAAAIAHLRKKWGDCVDFDNPVKIGREHYFRLVKDRARNGRSS